MENTNGNAKDFQLNKKDAAINNPGNFDFLFEEVSDPVFLQDFDGNILKVNKKACECLGYSSEELETKNITHIDTADLIQEYANRVKKLVKEGIIRFETKHLTKDKRQLDIEVVSKVIRIDNTDYILSSTRDISIRKDFEKQLIEAKKTAQENEDELKAIFNKTPSILILFDENAKILRVNRNAISVFKLEGKTITNLRIGDLINCLNTKNGQEKCGFTESCKKCALAKIIDKTILNGEEYVKKEIVLFYMHDDELIEKTLLLSTSILKRNGESVFLAAFDDITERKQIENELKIAKEKAEESDHLKTAFLANISHEIRTPLNGILGFINFFEDENISKENRLEYIEIINRSSDRLTNTINDIVEISKIDSSITNLNKEQFDFAEALTVFLTKNNWKYTHPEIKLINDIDNDTFDFQLNTDRSKLFQIIKNLLDNAYKFTSSGFVKISAKAESDEVIFAIQDSGSGISESDQKIVFEAFRQADSNANKAHDGCGLGLTIAQKTVNRLGGRIWMESNLGIGTTVYFSLPDSLVKKGKTIDMPTAYHNNNVNDLHGRTILVAEDELTNFMYVHAVLSRLGCHLIHAPNGQQAVNIFKQSKDLDLVLMDLKMPVMDGFEAAKQISQINNSLPIIAFSAFVMNEEKEKAKKSGCIDYITKPIIKQHLIESVSKHLNSKSNKA